MFLTRRIQERAADHFRAVQYPEPEWRSRRAVPRDWTSGALRWMVFAWAMWWIWGTFVLIVVCVTIALL
jgi:hypothetical protein